METLPSVTSTPQQEAIILDSSSQWDTSTINEIQFQICLKHQEEAKAFCTICNSLLCVFCMLNEDEDEDAKKPDH
jgi:DNA-binding ferritin-like protein (Dps family)